MSTIQKLSQQMRVNRVHLNFVAAQSTKSLFAAMRQNILEQMFLTGRAPMLTLTKSPKTKTN